MHKIDLKEAEARLSELAEEAVRGEEVILIREDGASFRLLPVASGGPRPKFGSAKGLIAMSEDFDEPLEDFEEYGP